MWHKLEFVEFVQIENAITGAKITTVATYNFILSDSFDSQIFFQADHEAKQEKICDFVCFSINSNHLAVKSVDIMQPVS